MQKTEETQVRSLGREDPLEEEVATHSIFLPRESCGHRSWQATAPRVARSRRLSEVTEHPRDGGAWWAAVYGVTQSWTRLKRLSSSSTQRT